MPHFSVRLLQVIPRAVKAVFSSVQEAMKEYDIAIHVTSVEIYNDEVGLGAITWRPMIEPERPRVLQTCCGTLRDCQMLDPRLLLLPAGHTSACLRVKACATYHPDCVLQLRLLLCRFGISWCTLKGLQLQHQPLQCARVL